jgi:hypothetical protein
MNKIAGIISIWKGTSQSDFLNAITSFFTIDNRQHYMCSLLVYLDGPVSFDVSTVLSSYKDLNVHLIENDENQGLGVALSKLFSKVKLLDIDFVFRIDDDDLSLPNRVPETLRLFQLYPDASLISLSSFVVDAKNGMVRKPKVINFDSKQNLIFAAVNSPIIHPACCFQLKKVRNLDFLYGSERYAQDYAMVSNLLQKGHRIITSKKVGLVHYLNKSRRNQSGRLNIEISVRRSLLLIPGGSFFFKMMVLLMLPVLVIYRFFNV